jgi:23S rRNA pseudouridine955/2504/2580 synthase
LNGNPDAGISVDRTGTAVQYREVDDDAGQRIDNFMLRELRGVPRSRVYRMLRKGEVRVNGRRIRPSYRLSAGDVVRLPPWHTRTGESSAPARPPANVSANLEQAIVFEDADLLVLNKPSGLAVHGGSGVTFGVIEALRVLRPDDKHLELAHRIDRDTSGCLVLTKNRRTLTAVHEAFRENRVRKRYDVLVVGRWPKRQRSVQLSLRRFVTRSGERRVVVDASGKAARTEYTVVEEGTSGTRLSAHPHTGRTHQIRVHCQASGHAIVGDEKYGSDLQQAQWTANHLTRLALHASSIKLPLAGGDRRFDAPIPKEFETIWQRLQKGLQTP